MRRRQLLRRYRALVPLVRNVLRNQWNPIGVALLPKDEYDDYIPSVIGLLMRGADRAQLAQYLLQIASDEMEESLEWAQQLAVADQLLAAYAQASIRR